MQESNPEIQFNPSKHQTIEEYINETLQLKTLKIKKFSFQDTFRSDSKQSKRLRNSFTAREALKQEDQKSQFNSNGWEPRLSYRRLMKQPKILMSVQKRKTKTSESLRKANAVFSAPNSRLGFRGQKVRAHSFYVQKSQQKIPKKLVIESNPFPLQKKHKQIPNFHFNFKYIIEQRKKSKEPLSIEETTKLGSNKGYFAFFGSQNFTKYLQKNVQNKNIRLNNKPRNQEAKVLNQSSQKRHNKY